MNHGDHLTANRGAIRGLLLVLGIPQALIGLWALIAPRSFYGDFPDGSDGWVAQLGPYNEHLVRDVGSLFVAVGVLAVLAAISLRRRFVIGATIAWLLYAVPHFVWHLANLDPLTTEDAIANTVTTGWTVVGGLAVLFLARTRNTVKAAATPEQGRARIAGVPDNRAGVFARGSYRYTKKMYGVVIEPTRIYAHHPTLLAGYGALEMATERVDRVPKGLKALASTKAAAMTGCEFCMDIASMISTETGVTEAKLRALPDYESSGEFDEVEKLVLGFAVGMTKTPVDVSDELFAQLAEHFDEPQLVELANEIAIENYRGRFNWAFGIPAQGFTDGAFCVRPETELSSVRPPA